MIHLGDRLGLLPGAGRRPEPMTSVDVARAHGLRRALGPRVAARHGGRRAARDRRRRAVRACPRRRRAVLVDEDGPGLRGRRVRRRLRPPTTSTAWPRRSAPASAPTTTPAASRAPTRTERMLGPVGPLGAGARHPPGARRRGRQARGGRAGARPRLRRRGGDGGDRRGVPAAARSTASTSPATPSSVPSARAGRLANVDVRLGRAEEVTEAGAYDLVLTFDCLHDMTRPADAIAAIRRAIAPDGTWLVKDIRCWPTWEQNRKNPMLAMFFGFSIVGVHVVGHFGAGRRRPRHRRAQPGELLESMARAAGFTRFTRPRLRGPRQPLLRDPPLIPARCGGRVCSYGHANRHHQARRLHPPRGRRPRRDVGHGLGAPHHPGCPRVGPSLGRPDRSSAGTGPTRTAPPAPSAAEACSCRRERQIHLPMQNTDNTFSKSPSGGNKVLHHPVPVVGGDLHPLGHDLRIVERALLQRTSSMRRAV